MLKNLCFNTHQELPRLHRPELLRETLRTNAKMFSFDNNDFGQMQLKSILKIGATNIGGKEYGQVLGAGLIGQQYFLSLTITP